MSDLNTSERGRGPRAGSTKTRLDRRRILVAAMNHVEEFGIHQLTMRRLGNELGVEAMSLYRYVPSRESLLDGIVEIVVDEIYGDPNVQVEPEDGWQDYLARLAHGFRRVAREHPRVFPLVATRPPEAPWVRPPLRSLRAIESFFAALTSTGFSDRAARDAYHAFSSFLLGHLLLEVSALGADVGPVEETEPRPPQAADLSDYPLLQRFEELLAEDRSQQEFEEALEQLLDRLEALRH